LGGIWGRASRTARGRTDFLPEKQTDSIFTLFAEEFGYVGAVPLMALPCLIVLGGMVIALRCRH
jgi:rod shape determining protein RodA